MYHLCRETSNIETVLLERDLLLGDWGSPVGPTRQPRGVSGLGGKRWARLPKTEPTVMLPGNCGAASHLSPSGFSVIVLTRFERVVDVCLFAVEACATTAPGSCALGRFPVGLRGPRVCSGCSGCSGRSVPGQRRWWAAEPVPFCGHQLCPSHTAAWETQAGPPTPSGAFTCRRTPLPSGEAGSGRSCLRDQCRYLWAWKPVFRVPRQYTCGLCLLLSASLERVGSPEPSPPCPGLC